VIVLLLIFLSQKTFAQPYYFRHYQVEDGLSHSTIFCGIQDSNGFMWFGTKAGLSRFDGYHFKLFDLTNTEDEKTITPDMVFSLYTDRHGKLWIGAKKGLFWFDAAKERLVHLADSLRDVHSFQMDRTGNLWFITDNILCRYDLKKNKVKRFYPSEYFYASSLCESEEGDLWVSTDDGFLKKFNPQTGEFSSYDLFSHSAVPASRHIQKIHAGDHHSLFIGTTSQGIKRFDLTSLTYTDILAYNSDKTTMFVRDILKNKENEFWFATESGIFIYQTDKQQFINLKKKFLDPYSLADNAVYFLCKDVEGGVWAGTFFGGVNYYAKKYAEFQKYFPDNSAHAISGSAVREICEDDKGHLWIGTEDAGLNRLDKKTGNITQYKSTGEANCISYPNIHGLMVARNDLWIGTFEHGIDIMDIRTGRIKKHYAAGPGKNDLKSNFTLCFFRHSSGDIYIGTTYGFYQYNNKEGNFKRPAEIPPAAFVSSLIEDHNKTIWIGTGSSGMFWYNPLTGDNGHLQNVPTNRNSLTNNTINAVFEDSNNNIWMATEGGGLCKLGSDRKTISRYTVKNGLPSNFIFKVLEDNNQKLWVSTSKGLVRFDPSTEAMTIYTKANGLLNDQFNYHSGYKDKEGNLYFGSVRGMISFNPDDLVADSLMPPVFITGFQVNNRELNVEEDSSVLKNSISFTRQITLPYYQSSVSLDFAALSYISPGMTGYKYKLDGLDKDWTFVQTNRKVYFTNLSPGKYTFKVKALKNGIWSKNEKELAIEILPPFWATWPAYLLYAGLIIGFSYYLIKNYHKRQQNKKEKEIYEAKIDFFTNVAHEIRTPLTLIKGPVENLLEVVDEMPSIKEDVTTMDRNTNRLIDLVSQILDFRQTEIKGFRLDFSRVDINALLQETYLSFKALAKKRNLDYEMSLPAFDIDTYADEEALKKIFSNLFSNAIKYADKKVHVELFMETGGNNIAVEIENDGYTIPAELKEKIFEPFYRLKNTAKQKGTGIGLTLARSLTELHKGKLYLKETKNGLNVFVFKLPMVSEKQNDQYRYKTEKV
jgi:ligand-binding sensor domain-containing protein/nitrogen-specific signal transduction histidine kinase